MGEYEKDIPWAWGKSIGKIWFDMECDGTREYIKSLRPNKIDQVLNFYGIPFIYKNEYKRFLKYRIQERHCWIVNDHFLSVLAQEWYDTSDFDYLTLQKEYIAKVPEAEQTALDLHTNYAEFLEKDKAHRDAVARSAETVKDEQIASMQDMMKKMMEQMEKLQSQVWNPNVLLSKNDTNDWQQPSWSDNESNATWNDWTNPNSQAIALQEDGETGTVEVNKSKDSSWSSEIQWTSDWIEWAELIWSWNTSIDLTKWSIWSWTSENWNSEEPAKTTKDRRNW